MNFNSLHFLLFMPIVILLYWLTPGKFRWMLLLVASYYFYMSWNARLVFLILGTTLVSYCAGIMMERTKKTGLKRLYLIIAVVTCLSVLIFFKYFNFLSRSITTFLNLFNLKAGEFTLDLILPIGISFYTFQTLSYVIDVYRGKFKAERHIGYYALFISFFPQLVAGPIERPGDLIPQLKSVHYFNFEDFFCGLRILAVGFFYKCVVADVLGVYVNNVLNNLASANALSIFIAGYLFATQMYCDFAGYSEIATGTARMMGIKLTTNFNRPYLSNSYSDFFHRWHITLTRWFTDYVYIPLGGSRCSLARRIFNTFVVFTLCGLWHGANWTYVLWGVFAAFCLSIETSLKKPLARFLNKMSIDTSGKTFYACRVIFTFSVMLIPAALIFRANDLSHVGSIFSTFFTSWGFGTDYFSYAMNSLGLDAFGLITILLFMTAEVLLWQYAEIGRCGKPEPLPFDRRGNTISTQRTVIWIYTVIAVMLCWLALLATGDTSAFQYFRF